MNEQINPSHPVQVFLNTDQFLTSRTPRQGGGTKDFFADEDEAFEIHKATMRQKIQGASEALRLEDHNAGYVIVQMRNEALAKSYRPINVLFAPAKSLPLVGGGNIGENFFQCTPKALDQLDERIKARAERVPKLTRNKNTGNLEPRVSTYRMELGGIDDIRLPTPSDRIEFSAREAVEWFNRQDSIGGYVVELFSPNLKIDREAVAAMINSFRKRLALFGGIVATPLFSRLSVNSSKSLNALSIRLTSDRSQSYVALPMDDLSRVREHLDLLAPSLKVQDLTVERHQEFLDLIGQEPLVRRVSLPPSLTINPIEQFNVSEPANLPAPPRNEMPVVGIIDGGVVDIPELSVWRTGGSSPVSVVDRDLRHGTFIAGLVAGATTLNPHLSTTLEPEGCSYYDVCILPRNGLTPIYFPEWSDFFDQLEEEVIRAKTEASVRIFNLSLGAENMRRGFRYSPFAKTIDDIAIKHDVIFVVSAGNLQSTESRQPWPNDPNEAVQLLATGTIADERIVAPSEHLLGLTVGAVNPTGVSGHNANLPTTYTRRGPGVGRARKPDVCHYGGVSSGVQNRTGLSSLAYNGTVIEESGTSFAAPLVASTLSTLDHRLESSARRETLIALIVHRAERCTQMQHPVLRPIARDFVGYGMTQPADQCLSDNAHSITLVFSETLENRQELQFKFSWPRSLVSSLGKCRGQVDITLAFTSPIDADFGAECLRVQLETYLYQLEVNSDTGEDNPQSRLSRYDCAVPTGLALTERYLLETGLKWTPVKRYRLDMPKGRGTSLNWRLDLKSSTRAGETIPDTGIPFTIIMTISDPTQKAQIYEEVRNEVLRLGNQLADITLAHRVRARH